MADTAEDTTQPLKRVVEVLKTPKEMEGTYCSFHWVGDPMTRNFMHTFCTGSKCANIIIFSDGTAKCGRA